MKKYDVIIIGAGPAGLSAGLYAGRARLSTLIIEKERDGGQIVQTPEVANYPGTDGVESGASIITKMAKQAESFGCEKIYDAVLSVEASDDIKTVKCTKESYQATCVIVAAGVTASKIGCKGEKEFTGQGVSYCATCDAAFFQNLEVFVAGGGDAAVEEAIYLTKFARKVTMIHKESQLDAAEHMVAEAKENNKIHYLLDTEIKEIKGQDIVNAIAVKGVKSGETRDITADPTDGMFGVFVFMGQKPIGDIFGGMLMMEDSYIRTDEEMKTNLPGIFAAGDIRVKTLRQVVTAAADGAIAATQCVKLVHQIKRKQSNS